MKNLKIICVCKGNDPRCIGGIETFERVLEKIFGNNILFFVFNTKHEKIFNSKNIINIQEAKTFKEKLMLKFLGKTKYLEYRVRQERPDIVIVNKPKDLRLFKNLKTILVQHTALSEYKSKYLKSKDVIKLIKRSLNYFVFLSENSQKEFCKELTLDINKTKVIRHCCEVELLENKKQKNKKLIIIARLENNQKRIDLAIKAMKKLPDFILEIYGAGSDEEMLNNLIKQEKLGDNVFLKGATNKVKEKLDECSIFIMTSDHEGYPITSIEAMRRGLPIVLRNTFESAQDIIEDNGILLEKEWNEDKFVEAVRKIYDNYEFYSKNAVEMGKRHDFEIIKFQWKELIADLSN